MSPSKQAKDIGLPSLNWVAEQTGQSIQTLNNWSKNKPKLFKAVILGCLVIYEENKAS